MDSRSQVVANITAVSQFHPEDRGIRSATPEEIRAGLTADVYFVGTQQILQHLHKQEQVVAAEVFANHAGILAGVEETLALLAPLPVTVEALEEGRAVAEKEVVMRITGRYGDFGLFETAILGILASSSGWATAAREVVEAAHPVPVFSFGARHVHPAVASVMDRAALVGGAQGASSILGARQAGETPSGTMPHALLLMVGDTVEAARAYDQVMPPEAPRVVLVDTFKDEAEEAIRVAEALDGRLGAIRLDTPRERGGVTPGLVREVRARLKQAGYPDVGVFVSGGLTPERIIALKEAGVTGFGVGSYIAAASPLDMTMDLKMVEGRPVAKRGRIPGLTDNPHLTVKLANAPEMRG
ncbi:nicotinate phosphoribosyltransferase [Sulfobacillus harzensis]|uniref:Nicotinate phosphoribosyltransferase n=1 Tax=Sulfobacillus harzensis TaxID=2729629 RepID=A0A7Y0L362_9FIRM|nr:nicotinate phosphoribosyltransferase [Sulfobacillus harzensis]NMP22448.1 nicotinate phosphoribosyltransferase [Sulfobacillus harzensis]